MSFRDNMPPLESVRAVVQTNRIVHLWCSSCDSHYALEVGDLLDIADDRGQVVCECGEKLDIPWGIRAGELA